MPPPSIRLYDASRDMEAMQEMRTKRESFWGVLSVVMGLIVGSGAVAATSDSATLCGSASPVDKLNRDEFCFALTSLHDTRQLVHPPDGDVYRLIAAPSVAPQVSIRVILNAGGTGRIFIRAFKYYLRTGHAPGLLVTSAALSAAEAADFRNKVISARFWELPVIADRAFNPDDIARAKANNMVVICGDGTGWGIEGWDGRRYHVSVSECAPYDGIQGLAEAILSLAETKFPALDLRRVNLNSHHSELAQ